VFVFPFRNPQSEVPSPISAFQISAFQWSREQISPVFKAVLFIKTMRFLAMKG
jgi:hypothetical protein